MPRQVTAVTRWVTWGWMGGVDLDLFPPLLLLFGLVQHHFTHLETPRTLR